MVRNSMADMRQKYKARKNLSRGCLCFYLWFFFLILHYYLFIFLVEKELLRKLKPRPFPQFLAEVGVNGASKSACSFFQNDYEKTGNEEKLPTRRLFSETSPCGSYKRKNSSE